MSNMSYCRFQNTAQDLLDCEEALAEGALDGGELGEDEERAAWALIRRCIRIGDAYRDAVAARKSNPVSQ